MQVIPIIGSVVGATTASHWAQTIKTTSVYGVIEVHSDIEDAQAIGMRIISSIIEVCSKPIQDLSSVQTLVHSIFVSEIQSIILLVPAGASTYIVIGGEGSVYIKRAGQYAKLLDQRGAISGSVQKEDVVILLSKACKSILSEQELFSIFDHLSADVLAEKLTLCLQGKELIPGCAALLFEVKEIREDETKHIKLPSLFSKMFQFFRAGSAYQITSIKRHVRDIGHKKQSPGVWITVLLISIFLVSIAMGIRREMLSKHDTKLQVVVQEAERMYEEGQALLELNAVKGRERLMGAKTLLAPVADIVTDKTKEERYVSDLYGRISSTLTAAMHIYIQEPQMFYDVGLLKLSGAVSTIGLSGDTLIIGDSVQKAVYALSISSKTGKIIGGGIGFENVSAVDVQGNTVYVFAPDGVHQIAMENSNTKLSSIKKNIEWGTIKTMTVFGGSVYLLDTTKSRIWKYIATDTGFSELKEYLNPDTLPDLSKTNSMAIDGSVWLGSIDGKILRFTQGKENTFVYKGVDPPFGQNLTVFTNDVIKNLYILDVQNKRVVVLDKDGIYLAQYVWVSDMLPSQLVVAEKQGKILLLAAGKLYSIDLK